MDLAVALQNSGRANVVLEHDGVSPLEPSIPSHVLPLSDGLTVYIRKSERILPDGSIGFHPDLIVHSPLIKAKGKFLKKKNF